MFKIFDFCVYVSPGEYQSAVSKIEGFAAPVVRALIPFGLTVPQSGARMGGLSLDAMKFFLKQQQKALEDNQGLEKAGERGRERQRKRKKREQHLPH